MDTCRACILSQRNWSWSWCFWPYLNRAGYSYGFWRVSHSCLAVHSPFPLPLLRRLVHNWQRNLACSWAWSCRHRSSPGYPICWAVGECWRGRWACWLKLAKVTVCGYDPRSNVDEDRGTVAWLWGRPVHVADVIGRFTKSIVRWLGAWVPLLHSQILCDPLPSCSEIWHWRRGTNCWRDGRAIVRDEALLADC